MARAILSDAERLAWERFPPEPDPDVIGAFFTLADGEVDALRRLPTPAARLAGAVPLVAIRWLGFVPAELDQVPATGVARLAGQLDVDPDALAGYAAAERTAREHRQRAARLARARSSTTRAVSTTTAGACGSRWRSTGQTRRPRSYVSTPSRCGRGRCCRRTTTSEAWFTIPRATGSSRSTGGRETRTAGGSPSGRS
jgi:Domain of unknown function (DUF4158)